MAWDAHCHADLYRDVTALRQDVDKAGIKVLAVTTTPRAYGKNVEVFGGSDSFRVALGIHPELAASREADLALFSSLLGRTRYIGEIGLDARPQAYRSFSTQRQVFRSILKLCRMQDKIMSIHSARAVKHVLDDLEEFCADVGTVKILHWFAGTKSEARRATDLGCYFSINSAMLSSDSGCQLIMSLPRERILTETDGPLFVIDKSSLMPSGVLRTIGELSRLWNQSLKRTNDQLRSTEAIVF